MIDEYVKSGDVGLKALSTSSSLLDVYMCTDYSSNKINDCLAQ